MMRRLTPLAVVIGCLALGACGSKSSAEQPKDSVADAVSVAAAPAAVAEPTAPSTTPTSTVVDDSSLAAAAPTSVAQDTGDTGGIGDTGPDDTAPAVDADFSGEGSGPFCELLRKFDAQGSPLDTAFGGTTPEETEAAWQKAVDVFGSLKAAAPDEIAVDVATATQFIDVMGRIFVENGFRMEDIAVALEADPELAALDSSDESEMQAATDRLDAYGVAVCGLSS